MDYEKARVEYRAPAVLIRAVKYSRIVGYRSAQARLS